MLDFNNEKEKQYYSEKFDSNNILKDIENIEKIEKNDDIIQPYLIKNSSKDYNYDLERMYLDIDEVQCIESEKLENELNYNFDDVKVQDLSKIEDLLESNIYVYSCNKNLKEKIPVYKSDKNFEKFLDLLLFENHYMLIKNIDRFFYPNVKNKSYFCRLC